jgi:ribosomal protein S18 acetylase RimI-like enzyme
MIEIKKLPSNRWKDYKKLRLEAPKNDSLAFGSSYEEEVTLPEEVWQNRIGHMLFAVINDRLIGMVSYVFENQFKAKHIAGIYSVYVDKDFRNQGIGSKLLDSAISVIKENKDILKIKLSVNPEQQFAVKLYNKHGFKGAGLFKNETCIDGKYYDELPMEKFL